MSTIVPFTFEGTSIRAVDLDGETHFVGKDVADALGYSDTVSAMKQHCRGAVKRHPIWSAVRLGGFGSCFMRASYSPSAIFSMICTCEDRNSLVQ